MMQKKTVLMFGLGGIGSWAVEFLARSEGVDRVVTSARTEDRGIYRTAIAAVGATYQGFSKELEFRRNDLDDTEATARLIAEVQPEVIFNAASVQGPGIIKQAPIAAEARAKLRKAGFGVWLPWHLLPACRLMQAVENAESRAPVVNIALPDVVNPALWRHFGFGPVVGAGNLDFTAATITRYISSAEGIPASDITLCLVGSHAFSSQGPRAGAPYFLKVLLGDRDITSRYDTEWLMEEWPVSHGADVRSRSVASSVYAASAVKNIMAILRDTNEYTHAPAPNGLPGGYPVRLSARGAEVVLPQELTLKQAIAINEGGLPFDGIARIEDDGSVTYTESTYEAMRALGYDCRQLTFDALEARSAELKQLCQRLIAGD